jgi:hypothetical protein
MKATIGKRFVIKKNTKVLRKIRLAIRLAFKVMIMQAEYGWISRTYPKFPRGGIDRINIG